jgi:hypothetical protein
LAYRRWREGNEKGNQQEGACSLSTETSGLPLVPFTGRFLNEEQLEKKCGL